MHSGTSSPNEPLDPQVVHSIFNSPGNQWTFEEIDSLNTNEIIKCLETLVWEGNENIWDYVKDMIKLGILGNNNRGVGPLVLNDEVAFRDYLKEQITQIQAIQQAKITAQETDQW